MWRRASRLRHHLHLYPRKSLLFPSCTSADRIGQGFGLTVGSEFYLLFNESAATDTDGLAVTRTIEYLTGFFTSLNVSMTGAEPNQRGFGVSLEIALPPPEAMHMVKGGCYFGCLPRRPLTFVFVLRFQDATGTLLGPGGVNLSPLTRCFSSFPFTPFSARWQTYSRTTAAIPP